MGAASFAFPHERPAALPVDDQPMTGLSFREALADLGFKWDRTNWLFAPAAFWDLTRIVRMPIPAVLMADGVTVDRAATIAALLAAREAARTESMGRAA